MKEITLSNGMKTKVSDEWYETLSKYKYHYDKGYACRTTSRLLGKQKHILMHREIMGFPQDMEIDHINGDKLDNRIDNLRVCTHSNNMKNVKTRIDNTSGYKGVVKKRNKWISQIRVNGKIVHLGTFQNPEDAFERYKEKAVEYFGEYCNIENKKS